MDASSKEEPKHLFIYHNITDSEATITNIAVFEKNVKWKIKILEKNSVVPGL